jgi:hypothetical protein
MCVPQGLLRRACPRVRLDLLLHGFLGGLGEDVGGVHGGAEDVAVRRQVLLEEGDALEVLLFFVFQRGHLHAEGGGASGERGG